MSVRQRLRHGRSGPGRPLAMLLLVLATLSLAACSGGAILAAPPIARPSPPPQASPPAPAHDPQPIDLPADDAPHHRLTEWWYYTGHLRAANGSWYGFEYVIFRAERGAFPVAWASHLALTDESGQRFLYAQRSEVGPQVDASADRPDGGFAFAITGYDPTRPGTALQAPWTMAGSNGRDELAAATAPGEATTAGGGATGGSPEGTTGEASSFGIQLDLLASKPPALHDTDGWIDFGPAGGSYYYSRTRMAATGTLTIDGQPVQVTGTAWFDHQWGDFIAVGGGGWDWFALGLDDGTDLTLSLVRSQDGSYPLVYGTLVAPDGSTRHLTADDFRVAPVGTWTSPRTGAVYPSGWHVQVPSIGLDVTVTPTLLDQELDTRATTGVVYWEGAQIVEGTLDGRPIAGRGYVELTGYAGGS
jgi:predicted secreted hydrolase